jgi:hypothetical protein
MAMPSHFAEGAQRSDARTGALNVRVVYNDVTKGF